MIYTKLAKFCNVDKTQSFAAFALFETLHRLKILACVAAKQQITPSYAALYNSVLL